MTAGCHRSDVAYYCAHLLEETDRLASVTEGRDVSTPVPTCPGWSLDDLIQHVAGLHRWSSKHVETLSPTRIRGRDIELGKPADASEYPRWLRDGATAATAIFSAADPEAPVWVWGSDKHTRFWSRRMVFETAIHRVDAEIALGVEPAVDPALSIDGIDEFLDNLPFASYFAPRVDLLRGTGERLRFVATDAGVAWTLTFSPETLEWDHSNDGDAQATVSGTASDLLLYVYGRSDRVAQSGDEAVLTLWRENSAI